MVRARQPVVADLKQSQHPQNQRNWRQRELNVPATVLKNSPPKDTVPPLPSNVLQGDQPPFEIEAPGSVPPKPRK